ncbi:hypothetical protein ATY81_26875 [Rhizobium sp. R72]|uniref:hypothetical protein n=1 Tax=unclassified Rhizobium TaxID=2613769 RepID=UPI000B52AED3|nr:MULTISPECIES: hypothetical protein [unclassified Rhizobium]OWV98652.1 hypothetical protein ATY81_26875 [Rhizobium sp. R72]OWV98686.1 hypothetical protein ATY80_26875 [Rhizobium sp. R711]
MDPDDLTTQYNAAAVYSIVGELDTAMHILEAYMQRVADDMFDVIRHDDCLERIRDHPPYDRLDSGGLSSQRWQSHCCLDISGFPRLTLSEC